MPRKGRGDTMTYTIQACRVGQLVLKGSHAFADFDPHGAYPYNMYVWLIRGRGLNLLVDTGPKDLDVINRGLAGMCIEPVTQNPGEDVRGHLERAGLTPEQIHAVYLTHGHYDHTSNLDLFPTARIVINRRGWERALLRPGPWPGEVYFPLQQAWRDRVVLVEDEPLYPGIATFWVGGHTYCSQAITVETRLGKAVITGDVVSLYENLERNEPIGVYEDLGQVRAAMEKIRRTADIVLPSHDPAVLNRFPSGRIG